jgi:hypothetical protein
MKYPCQIVETTRYRYKMAEPPTFGNIVSHPSGFRRSQKVDDYEIKEPGCG